MGFLKFTRKSTAAKPKAARLLTYVGRPNNVRNLCFFENKCCLLTVFYCILLFCILLLLFCLSVPCLQRHLPNKGVY